MLPPRALTNASMSEKTTDADVGLAKTAARVLRCFEFTGTCYHLVLALAIEQHWRDDLVMVNVRAKRATTAGRQGPVGENVPRTADRALVACRWRSA